LRRVRRGEEEEREKERERVSSVVLKERKLQG
jgi:hypothetical protein